MDFQNHQQVKQDVNKAVSFCVVLILCVSGYSSVCILRFLDHPGSKQNNAVDPFQFNLVPFYDAVSECAPEAIIMLKDSINYSCIVDQMQINKSFPLVRFFYVVGSFLFLSVTLNLHLSSVSGLVWGSIVLCNFVFFLDRLATVAFATAAGAR